MNQSRPDHTYGSSLSYCSAAWEAFYKSHSSPSWTEYCSLPADNPVEDTGIDGLIVETRFNSWVPSEIIDKT